VGAGLFLTLIEKAVSEANTVQKGLKEKLHWLEYSSKE